MAAGKHKKRKDSTPCLLGMLCVLLFSAIAPRAEDLTTLDGKTYTNITEISKFPKQVFFTCNGGRVSVAITNLPEDFKAKYKVGTKTNHIATTSVSQPNPDDSILLQNNDLFECDYEEEKGSHITNARGEKVYKSVSWQMCLRGTRVDLKFYESEGVTEKRTQSIHFVLGQTSIINQAFDKFQEWNAIATTNKAESFEKVILQCPDPSSPALTASHEFKFQWNSGPYGGGKFWDVGCGEGGFDTASVTRFQTLLQRLPELKTKLLKTIQNRQAQRDLFK